MQRHKKFSSIGNIVDRVNPYITKSRKITKIIFHCTATVDGQDIRAKDVDNMHMNRWGINSGMGYHYLIRIDGVTEKGRWADYPGSHAGPKKKIGRKSSNPDTLGVVYSGGINKNKAALKDGLNEEQKETAVVILAALVKGHGLTADDVIGHGELPKVNKACPCTPMDELRERIRECLQQDILKTT